MKTRIKLEPLGRWTTLVIAAHIVAGLGIWWWLEQEIEVAASPSKASGLVWMSPSDFKAPAAAVTEAISSEPTAADVAQQPSPTPEPTPSATPSPAPVAPIPDAVPAPRAIAIPANSTPEDIARILAVMQARAPSIPAKPAVMAGTDSTASNSVAKPMPRVAATQPSAAPMPPIPPPAAKTETSLLPPPPEVSRVITVQHLDALAAPASSAPPAGASLADIAAYEASGTNSTGTAKGLNMDTVDRAIMRAFTQNWVVRKEFADLPATQRDAHMDIVVGREGQVLRFVMAKPSGNKAFDESVLAAGNRVENIQSKLPAEYPGERYEIQVNFHAE